MKYVILFLLFFGYQTIAQKLTIRGMLIDSTGSALPSATVMLLSTQDSVLVAFTTTDNAGAFEIKNLAVRHYLLKVTYVGFAPLVKPVEGTENSVVDLGRIMLQPRSKELDEITITAEGPPVVVKKDTIEFNAVSFKPRENSTVEELLKKLPGIEVDNDGTIRAQGEQVQRMTVDGKNFFGSDPKIASKNLPADVVSKVQVYDRKSDQATFSGIDDGQREKTINLELKPEKRNGAFGLLNGGIGTDNRFQAKGNLNKFSKTRQLSILAMANNINEQGFGIEEYLNFTGGSQQMMSGGGQVRVEVGDDNDSGVPLSFGNRPNGLMSSYAGGINFNKDVNKKMEVNSSYFYNQLDHNITSDLQRINYLPDGSQTEFLQRSTQNNTSYSHRGYTMIDFKVDSLNALKFTATGTYTTSHTDQVSASETRDDAELLNTNSRQVNQDGVNLSINSSLLWRHKFSKKGRVFSANAQFVAGESQKDGTLASVLENQTEQNNIFQNTDQDVDNFTYGATVSYTEPIGKRKYLEGNFTYRENRNEVINNVTDIDAGVETRNELLSTAYKSAYQYKRGGINFRAIKKNYNLVAGASLQHTRLDGQLDLQETKIQKSFLNILPSVRFNYDFSNTKHLSFDIETSVQEPSIRQLQPVFDNSDPVNLYSGNPDLRPAYSNNVRLNFRGINPVSFLNFFAYIEARLTKNAITTSQTWTANGVRILRPENVAENQRYTGDVNFGFPINILNSRIGIGTNFVNELGYTVINSAQNAVVQNILASRLRYDFQKGDILNVGLAFRSRRQTQNYESQESMDQLFFNNTLSGDVTVNFLKTFSFTMAGEYLKYINKTLGQKQEIPLIDLSVSRYLIKGRNGELKLGVYNLLNKDIGISQSASLNYYERQQYNNLGRYFMLSFTYNINKQINPMAGPRPGGHMIRIIE